MTTPRTRMTEGTTDFERDLLRSWEGEQPSDHARRRALALVGTAVGVSAVSSTAAASLSGATAGATTLAGGATMATVGVVPKAATLGAFFLSYWLAAGVLVVGVAGVSLEHTLRSSAADSAAATAPLRLAPSRPPSVPAPQAARASTSPGRGTETVPPPSPPPPPLEVAVPAPSEGPTPAPGILATAAPLSRPVHAPPPGPSAEGHSALGLGDEVLAIDRARSALAKGDATAALRGVDAYESAFPAGILTQEATALRIEALVDQGHRDAATDVADRFLASHPTSPHAARIRLLVRP